jgi:hypothetical protein
MPPKFYDSMDYARLPVKSQEKAVPLRFSVKTFVDVVGLGLYNS